MATPLNNNSNVQTQMYKHCEWKQALVPLFFVDNKKKTCFRVVYIFYGLAITTAIRWMKIVGEHEFIFVPGPSVHYMCSQYLADSSLSEDVSQYDFSTPIQVKLYTFEFAMSGSKDCSKLCEICCVPPPHLWIFCRLILRLN